jgi:hypothetical protein
VCTGMAPEIEISLENQRAPQCVFSRPIQQTMAEIHGHKDRGSSTPPSERA